MRLSFISSFSPPGLSKRNSKVVSRQFQRRFKKVSRVLARVKCVSRKLQWCFKNILMKFCFMILLLHGSHRNYPSRRRACCCCCCWSANLALKFGPNRIRDSSIIVVIDEHQMNIRLTRWISNERHMDKMNTRLAQDEY